MKLGYTEFSFGYAFTENLIRASATAPAGAPVFPNLIQEAQLGYDVRIDLPGCPLFFQYKLPELMIRNNASEILSGLAGISVRFFRMPLMRRDLSDQHQSLIELEKRFPRAVYYASPLMEDISSFNAAYNTAKVHWQSTFFSPQNIGQLPDDKQHVIAYKSGLKYAWRCSQPREVVVFSFEDIDNKTRFLFEDTRFSTLEVATNITMEGIRELVPSEVRSAEGAIRQRTIVRRAITPDRAAIDQRTEKTIENLLISREMARVGLGIDMLIAQPREKVGEE